MRVLVVVPTYNEASGIETVLRRIREELPQGHVLVVDDNSPDGTAELVDAMGASDDHVTLLRRAMKAGLGSAYLAGFAAGLDRGFDVLVEMDADLSHDPAALPALVSATVHGADVAIGSRYVAGGSIPDWTRRRAFLSRWGNRYAALALGLAVNDSTSGYRAYRADALRRMAGTSQAASTAIRNDIFDSPRRRSRKTIGTSTTSTPAHSARYVNSTWKA